ncbi:uncharacterized protein LOC142974209 [Anticarsia gemmatalis]|uniref:uncharacterized protein LOC142974209 n=1 Tax=Anticarsia gemmatalis TaxID=129554 RepID=UPI003F7579E5
MRRERGPRAGAIPHIGPLKASGASDDTRTTSLRFMHRLVSRTSKLPKAPLLILPAVRIQPLFLTSKMLQGIQHKPSGYHIAYIKSDVPKMVPIAPAPDRKYLTLDLQADKKKYTYKNTAYSGAQAASIARRNARERNRVKQVNDGFNALRKRLPAAVVAALSGGARRGSGKKLSKVDTLRMVVEYIKYLQNLIDESDAALGITKPVQTESSMPYEVDEGIFGDSSPYSESVPSPVGSDCSSGVSSAYSGGYVPNYQTQEQVSAMDEDDLLDAISWWQQK